MKISLAWVFDYIDYPLSKVDVDQLVHLFNTRTAEIEQYEKCSFDLKKIYAAQVVESNDKECVVYSKELDQTIKMPARNDAVAEKYYFITRHKQGWSWVAFEDFDSEKEGLFPAVNLSEKLAKGSWRKEVDEQDYILDVDNKSINHRPDLWGHYGIAREIAAFLHLKLRPLDKVLESQKVAHFSKKSKKSSQHSYEINLEDIKGCSRFAGLYGGEVTSKASDVAMAFRLLKVGARPIDTVVDLTNYVMFDVGHPMHVFDAKSFKDKKLIVRKAHKNEKLVLLDNQKITLRTTDLVVANDEHPVALAGIMGGKDSGFSEGTKEIFLEAAGFEATGIRKTAQHFKLRTEASARFEKQLDPMQNVAALQRFLYLAYKLGVLQKVQESIVSVGHEEKERTCHISHQFIEEKIGMPIKQSFIQDTLGALGFKVVAKKNKSGLTYSIGIPSYRVLKDVELKEDILEEIVRMYGFEQIAYELPRKQTIPFDTHAVRVISQIKRYLAFACRMHEVQDYLFYDESFIRRLGFNPKDTLTVKNPVSENWAQLVNSLVPHLLKNVELNSADKERIRLFEWNPIWTKQNKEESNLAGIMFDKKSVDFYEAKAELQGLWDQIGLNVEFNKPKKDLASWYDPHKTAELYVGEKRIGFAGMMNQEFMQPIVSGSAFIFELDGSFLTAEQKQETQFKAWSKYQDAFYDISMMVPLKVSAAQLQEAIMKADDDIASVELVDFFEKDEWINERALTFRYQMSSMKKGLDKKEMDKIAQAVVKAVEKYDAKVR